MTDQMPSCTVVRTRPGTVTQTLYCNTMNRSFFGKSSSIPNGTRAESSSQPKLFGRWYSTRCWDTLSPLCPSVVQSVASARFPPLPLVVSEECAVCMWCSYSRCNNRVAVVKVRLRRNVGTALVSTLSVVNRHVMLLSTVYFYYSLLYCSMGKTQESLF